MLIELGAAGCRHLPLEQYQESDLIIGKTVGTYR